MQEWVNEGMNEEMEERGNIHSKSIIWRREKCHFFPSPLHLPISLRNEYTDSFIDFIFL